MDSARTATHPLEELSRSLLSSQLSALALAVLLWWMLGREAPMGLPWLAYMGAVAVGRLWLGWRSRGLAPDRRRWAFFLAGALLSGLGWGAAVPLFGQGGGWDEALLAFTLGGVVAGGSVSLGASLAAFLLFSLPALLPLAYHLAVAGGDRGFALAGMVSLFLVVLIDAVRRQSGQFRAVHRLAGQMEEARAALTQREAALDRYARVLDELYSLGLQNHEEAQVRLKQILALGRRELGLAGVHLAIVEEGAYRLIEVDGRVGGLGPGVRLPLEDSPYGDLRHSGGVLLRPDLGGRGYLGLPGVESLLAVEGRMEGDPLVLAFHDDRPGPRYGPEEGRLLCLLLHWCAETLAARRSHGRLRDSEARLRLLLDSVGEGVYGVGLDGAITFINAEGARLLGYDDPGALVGRRAHDTFHHTHRDGRPYPAWECPLESVFREGRPRQGDDQWFWRQDGSGFPVEYVARPLERNGLTEGAVVVFRDVSERQAVARRQSEFVSTVSHELRTPLTSILGGLDLVLKGAGGTGEARDRLLSIARNNAERLLHLVNDLLDMDKIQSGRLTLRLEPVDAAEVVAREAEAQAAYAERHQVRIVTDRPQGALWVRADAGRLAQVVDNLLSNAIKFSRPGQAVTLCAKREGEQVVIQVEDHGEGIPEEFHDRVFQRFAQADSSNTRSRGGTGLGLAITHALVTRMGGEITFRSRVGEGSVFWVRLPAIALDPKREEEVKRRV